jgi:hypothetical protein
MLLTQANLEVKLIVYLRTIARPKRMFVVVLAVAIQLLLLL